MNLCFLMNETAVQCALHPFFFFTPIKQDEEDCEVVRLKLLVYSLSYSSYFCTSS